MAPERAYLIVSQAANPGSSSETAAMSTPDPGPSPRMGRFAGSRVRARPDRPRGAAAVRRPPSIDLLPLNRVPRAGILTLDSPARRGLPPPPRTDRPWLNPPARLRQASPASARPTARPRPSARDGGTPMLVRRHRPGRHRIGGPGLHHYRRVIRHGDLAVRPRLAVSLVPARCGRHVAPHPAAGGAAVARYASLVVVLSTVLISGWFAASGASAFAQLIGGH